MKRKLWISSFLIVTAAAIGMELWAAWDTSPDTVPWTHLIARFVPAAVTTAAIGWLISWLPGHFKHAYKQQTEAKETRMSKYAKFIVAALAAALAAAIPLMSDGNMSAQEGLMVASAGVGAILVYLIPNKTEPTRVVETDLGDDDGVSEGRPGSRVYRSELPPPRRPPLDVP